MFQDIDDLLKEIEKFKENVAESEALIARLEEIKVDLHEANIRYLATQDEIAALRDGDIKEIKSTLLQLGKKIQTSTMISIASLILIVVVAVFTFLP